MVRRVARPPRRAASRATTATLGRDRAPPPRFIVLSVCSLEELRHSSQRRRGRKKACCRGASNPRNDCGRAGLQPCRPARLEPCPTDDRYHQGRQDRHRSCRPFHFRAGARAPGPSFAVRHTTDRRCRGSGGVRNLRSWLASPTARTATKTPDRAAPFPIHSSLSMPSRWHAVRLRSGPWPYLRIATIDDQSTLPNFTTTPRPRRPG